ncbi:GNAT family N-acetyltransferase [Paenibacillus polygoni]|uniref:GNAT family N-acetyltransferase n=1 Tax=Paenibacillus polygoni TaxID=3050112 RepID=A0ABY8X811_9BACL|nr:GNAT family N-acetyltransferase [Paenibacillus polygoni]WIV21198.1 GNAT family N-acetyltransferase [Paenibacillus polygoni]
MEDLVIELYNPERDRTLIKAMLNGNEQYDEIFRANEGDFQGNIIVARYKGVTVGFLSFGPFRRQTVTTIFIRHECRRMGIGSELMKRANQLLLKNEEVERSIGVCVNGDHSSLQFIYKNGYYISYSSYIMELEGEFPAENQAFIRPYEEDDYITCHNISELAFFKMHEHINMLPSYYYPPNERERQRFAEDRTNRFVMLVDDEIVAVGIIDGSELSHVSVRPELQGRGYGRTFVTFLVNEIKRRGAKTVKLWVLKGNPAKKLYESLGFREKSLNHWVTKYYRPDTRLSRPPSHLLS